RVNSDLQHCFFPQWRVNSDLQHCFFPQWRVNSDLQHCFFLQKTAQVKKYFSIIGHKDGTTYYKLFNNAG
ncbi:MAG: hypothetical protein LBS12_05220, partial [Prevotellaceae bacterium]|nr:hypothetical protein [Prevotellaceae bacterium]